MARNAFTCNLSVARAAISRWRRREARWWASVATLGLFQIIGVELRALGIKTKFKHGSGSTPKAIKKPRAYGSFQIAPAKIAGDNSRAVSPSLASNKSNRNPSASKCLGSMASSSSISKGACWHC